MGTFSRLCGVEMSDKIFDKIFDFFYKSQFGVILFGIVIVLMLLCFLGTATYVHENYYLHEPAKTYIVTQVPVTQSIFTKTGE